MRQQCAYYFFLQELEKMKNVNQHFGKATQRTI